MQCFERRQFRGGKYCSNGFRVDCSVHRPAARIYFSFRGSGPGGRPPCAFYGRRCPHTAVFSTISPTLIPASECGILKSRPSILRSCFAGCSPAGDTLKNIRKSVCWLTRFSTEWIGVGCPKTPRLLPHGWTPEFGFLPYRWDYYSEMMMIYLLGLGSLPHPLPAEAWNAWKRTKFEYDGIRYIGSFAPLFVHQYSQAWFDFRGKRDQYADYFENSIFATDAHRRFCLELGKQFPDYSDDLWGISASDSQKGYVIWGGPPMMGPIDGTVVPSASAGSLPFMTQPVMRVLRNIKTRYPQAWSRYGFVNAFNPLKNWYDTDTIGIDAGITMLMAENVRTGFVWKTFMKNQEAQRGMDRAGFKKYQP